ncbi:MAG: EI24 domain-containing protein [Deltaproteobacteria bacterium]|nr:EI24 domain-containing protein [Deltaproteobacteria bacterium]
MKTVIEGAGAVLSSPLGFARGLSYPFRGMRFVYFRHPKLARYWVFPILITAVALFGVFYGAASYYDDLGEAVWSWMPASWDEATGWVATLLGALRGFIELLLGLLLALLGLVLVVILSSIVAAPFNDALSEAVEHILTGEPAPSFSFKRMVADIVRTIRLEALKVLVYAAVVGPMFLASFFVPGVGQLISLVGFALTAIYLGVDYVDWPAARRGWSVADRVTWTRQRLAAVAGFGTGVWVLLFVPLVNLFFMPAAVAGGTMLFVALQPPTSHPTPARG